MLIIIQEDWQNLMIEIKKIFQRKLSNSENIETKENSQKINFYLKADS